MSNASSFVAACVQMRSGRDVGRNTDAAAALIREAAGAGAIYIQTPEMSNVVERERDRLFTAISDPERDPMLAALRDLARGLRIHLHIGSLAQRSGDKIVNRAYLIDTDGAIAATYDKVHLYDADLPNGESWRESATYTGGDEAVIVPAAGVMLGLSICYDVRFAYLYRQLAEAGAQMLTAPACFTRQTGEAHWNVLQRARAIENGAFMISAAQAGRHDDGRETFGHSIIVDPWGVVLAEAAAEPGVILARIDPSAVATARGRIPTLRHTRNVAVRQAGGRAAAA